MCKRQSLVPVYFERRCVYGNIYFISMILW